MKKFVTYNENMEVQLIHNMPFDSVNGLGMSESQLLQIGTLVDEIPTIDCPNGKVIVYKYNPTANAVYCELVDSPMNEKEVLENKVKLLEQELAKAEYKMMMGGLI